MKDYKFKNDENSKKYIYLLKNAKQLLSQRDKILNRHFYEFNHYNIDDLEDRNGQISRIIGKPLTYPNAFLASSLGFNRSTWNKKYEHLLNKLGLGKKLKYQTLRNMLAYEKLKYLIIKYFEMEKKAK